MATRNPSIPPKASANIPPLSAVMPIVGPGGVPTMYFLELWQNVWASIVGGGGLIEGDAINLGLPADAFGAAESLIAQASDKPSPISSLAGRLATLEQRVGELTRAPYPLFVASAFPLPERPAQLPFSATAIAWQPGVAGLTTAGTPSYSTQWGVYMELGPLIVAQFSLTLSATGGMAGALVLAGLPFPARAATGTQGQSGHVGQFGGTTLTAGYTSLGLVGAAGTPQAAFVQSGSAVTPLALPATALAATASVSGSLLYFR